MPRLIAQLSEICRSNLLGEKIVIAPSLAIGHQIGDAIAQRGTSWVNLRFESVRTLVDTVIGFDLVTEGMRVLSRAQALALVEKACDRALGRDSYFAALADRPGLHRAVQRSLDDLRLAGARAAMTPGAFEDARKAADLARVMEAYDEELQQGRYIDRAGVLLRAIEKLQQDASSPWSESTSWIVLEDVELSSEEERFLQLVSGGRAERLEEVAAPDSRAATPAATEKGQLSLFAPVAKRSRASVHFVRAVGEENELRAAFRTLLGGDGSFDGAEIVYSRQDAYLPLAYELSAELAVPCTFAEGIAGSYTRPGQACLSFLEWVGAGWEARTLQDVVRGGALLLPDLEPGGESQPLSPTAFSRILRDARIGWGRERYLARIDAWLSERSIDDDDDERRAAQRARELARGRAARKLCEELLVVSQPVADGDEIEMTALASAGAAFVRTFAAVRSEIDAMAQSGLRRMLEELADLPPAKVSRLEGTERLKEAVRHLHVSASNPRPGHLHVAPLRAGGWSGRARVFVVGLDDAKYPGSGLQDPILLDSERAAINRAIGAERLQMRGEAPERTTRQFEHLMERLTGCRDVFISFPMLDVIERRALYPAGAVLEVFRRFAGETATYHDAIAAAGEPAGFVDDRRPLSESEWWLSRSGGTSIDAAALRQAFPLLASGHDAVAARESSELTKWDGFIQAPKEEIDPRHTGKIYSASQLEKMASCPIGYFFERHLKIEPVEELHRDPDVWLNAMENGSLFHSVAERFMKEVCAAGASPSKGDRQRLDEIAEEELRHWRLLVPPPNEAAYEKRREELFEIVTVFLRGEVDCGTVRAKFFEAPFGYPEKEGDGIALPEPLTLNLGGGRSVKLRGKIDRVDFDESTGLWNVWDYKTGSTYQYRSGERLARGTKIQHAIYAKAICAMLERQGQQARVGQSGYYFPTPKGRALRQARACGEGELEHALNLLFDVVGNGFFPHPTVEACKYCDYADVTGDRTRAAEQMAQKFAANASHPAVEAWLALQEVK